MPKNSAGYLLGPDYANKIRVVLPKDAAYNIKDNLDGSYTIQFAGLPANTDPLVKILVLEEELYSGPLSRMGQK